MSEERYHPHRTGADDGRGAVMAQLNYERLAAAALDTLLAGGLEITQHYYEPDPNE